MHTYFAVNPERDVPPEVETLTGLTTEFLKTQRPFAEHAALVARELADCYLCGFNCLAFDVPLLAEEMLRAGVEFDFPLCDIIDAGNIFKKKEPRGLEAAVAYYCGRKMEGAHHALADARATADVLLAQLDRYEDLGGMTPDKLAAFSRFNENIDYAGKLVRDKDGDACYNIGKARGVKVRDDLGFGRWMLGKDFPLQTKRVLEKIIHEIETAEMGPTTLYSENPF
jgi:DNA polymerase-3 subunit epsilon